MTRVFTTIFLMSILIGQPALADESKDDDFARYAVNLGGSLFGPSANFAYNTSRKTMFVFAMGAFSGDAPFKPKIGDIEYTVNGSTSWMGFFVNHRLIDSAEWFRVVAGLGIGNIENELKDTDGNTYRADYNENPVAYLGVGFGTEAKKGFLWGVDIGLLQTAGSRVIQTAGTGTNETLTIRDYWMFGSLLPNAQLSIGWGF